MDIVEARIFFDGLDVGVALEIIKIGDTRNFNFIVTSNNGKKYLLKVYNREKRGAISTELLALSRLSGLPYAKALIKSGENFILSEFVEGEVLKDFFIKGNPSESQINYIVLQVVAFIRNCISYEGSKFGRIEEDGSSKVESWGECLLSYMDSLLQRARNSSSLDKAYLVGKLEKLRAYFSTNRGALNKVKSKFVPVDLNLTNFIVGEKDRVIATDLESFWHADPLLAYGDWMGNTYGTALFDAFSAHWGVLNPADQDLVHAYALLSNLSALLYVSENSEVSLRDARPWGNPNSYLSLVALHEKSLFEARESLSFASQHFSVRNVSGDLHRIGLLSWPHMNSRISEIMLAIRRFSNIEFDSSEDFYALVYGSYAYRLAQPSSDLDLVFVAATVDKARVERIISFVKSLHDKYGMRRDDEIPYEFKVAFTSSFVSEASLGAGIRGDHGWSIPEIVKTREYLTSKPLLLRFVQGMLANPHIFAAGNHALYAQHRFDATCNLIKAVLTINGVSRISAAQLVEYFCVGMGGVSGDFYLGFSLREPFRSYLMEYLEVVLRRMKPPVDFDSRGAVYEFTPAELLAVNAAAVVNAEEQRPTLARRHSC